MLFRSFNVTAGSFDTTYGSSGADRAIYVAALKDDDSLVIGGDFSTVNGVLRNRLARLDISGALDPIFNVAGGPNGIVRSLHVYRGGTNSGQILIGGNFTSVTGTNRNYIARLNKDATVDVRFDPGPGADNVVYSLAVQNDGRIVADRKSTRLNSSH